MISTAEKVVSIALSYLGCTKYSAKHRKLVKIFNSVKPHGYTASVSDPWCAIAWSAWQIQAGNTMTEVPMSASCSQIIADAKAMGIWVESDSFIPSRGDAILYDWQDSGRGDNVGSPDHIGLVYDVDASYIYVIEGNKGQNSVCGKRAIDINGRFIRGFVHPQYQHADLDKVDVDGVWGYMTTLLSQKVMKTVQDGIISGQRTSDKKYLPSASESSWEFVKSGSGSQLIMAVQRLTGAEINGLMGKASVKALQRYLKDKGLYDDKIDGKMGIHTVKGWQELLNSKAHPPDDGGRKIADKAHECAYTTNDSRAKYPQGKPKKAYKDALNEVYPDRSRWGKAPSMGASCDVFVGTVIRASGIDKDFPRGLADQIPYLHKSSKFTEVKVTADSVKDGDIIVYTKKSGGGHICIVVKGKIKEASYNMYYPKTTNYLKQRLDKSGKSMLKVYRAD